MRHVTIVRQNHDRTPTQASDVTVHLFPFQTLPVLESHIHPKFVILDAAPKIAALEATAGYSDIADALIETLANSFPVIKKLKDIYEAWDRDLDHVVLDCFTTSLQQDDDQFFGGNNSRTTGESQSQGPHLAAAAAAANSPTP